MFGDLGAVAARVLVGSLIPSLVLLFAQALLRPQDTRATRVFLLHASAITLALAAQVQDVFAVALAYLHWFAFAAVVVLEGTQMGVAAEAISLALDIALLFLTAARYALPGVLASSS